HLMRDAKENVHTETEGLLLHWKIIQNCLVNFDGIFKLLTPQDSHTRHFKMVNKKLEGLYLVRDSVISI
ncbi:unnamed protein product, partial [Allacma fusca]